MILYVLDACALLTYFKSSERGHRFAVDFMKSHSPECAVHAMNMTEVFYRVLEDLSLSRAEDVVRQTRAMGVQIIESTPESLWTDVGWLKVSYRLSLMDAMAFGLARQESATLVTRDRAAFEGIKKANVAKVNLF